MAQGAGRARRWVGAAAVLLAVAAGCGRSRLPAPHWQAAGGIEWLRYGTVVGSAGDLNRDGFADLLVLTGNDPERPAGRLMSYLGSPNGLPAAPARWVLVESGSRFSVAAAGDVNGDGYADLLAGAPESDMGYADEGQVFLYLGGAGGLAGAPAWSISGGHHYAQIGWSVAGAGDVNGDGLADIVIGSRLFGNDQGYPRAGQALLFLGSPQGPATEPDWRFTPAEPYSEFGTAVSSAGDVNGDGYDDLLVGAPNWRDARGQVYLFYGSARGPSSAPDWTAAGPEPYSYFGWAVAGAGTSTATGTRIC